MCGLDSREAGGCICPWETKNSVNGMSKPNQERQLLEMSQRSYPSCSKVMAEDGCGWGWHGLFNFLMGLILMLSPAPWQDESSGSYSSRKGPRLVPSCSCNSDPLSKAGGCFVYFSGGFDSYSSAQSSTQKQCLRKQQRYGWTDSKRSGDSRHIIIKIYSCLS